MSDLEETLLWQIKALKLPPPERETKVIPGRRFRFDFYWPDPRPGLSLAVEVEGGTWVNGGHNRGGQIESDCEKSALAAMQGIRFMRVTADQVKSGAAVQWIEQALR